MIWLTWRQQRLETIIGLVLLGLIAVVLIPSGLDLAAGYAQTSAACREAHGSAGVCYGMQSAFILGRYAQLATLFQWLPLLPLAIGMLVAAPFVMDLEQGTFRLALSQSVTCSRWLTVRLAVMLLGTVVGSIAVTALVMWWRIPVDHAQGRLASAFELEGVVPIAYAIFALALLLAVGALLRRTIPAMGMALVAFLVTRFVVATWIRPHYQAPIVRTWPIGVHLHHQFLADADWVVATGESNRSGNIFSSDELLRLCRQGNGITQGGLSHACLERHGLLYNTVVYHPAGRFWLFQGIESLIFVALASALLGTTAWWVRNRLT
jgi:hypothetical protein